MKTFFKKHSTATTPKKIFNDQERLNLSPLSPKNVRQIIEKQLNSEPFSLLEIHHVKLIQVIVIVTSLFIAFFAQILLQARFTQSLFSGFIRPIFASNFSIAEPTAAAILFFASAILFATHAPILNRLQINQYSPQNTSINTQNVFYQSQWIVLGLSGVCYLVSIFLFIFKGESNWVRMLWLTGIALLVISQCLKHLFNRQNNFIGPITPSKIAPFVAIFAITGLAFFLRAYQLDTIPMFFHGDVASIGLQSRDILLGKENQLFKLGWAVHPMMAFIPTTLTQFVFGDNLFGIRVAPLFMGTAMVAGMYLLIWRFFDNHFLAAITSFTLAVTSSHIIYSHLPTLLDPWVFAIWGWFFLIDGLRRYRNISFVLAGLFSGMSLQLYHSGRLNGFILTIFLVYLLLFHRKKITSNFMGLGLFVVSIFYILGPNLITFINVGLVTRGDAFVFSNPAMLAHLQNKYNVNTSQGVLFEQIRRTFLMFHIMGDGSSQIATYLRPMFTELFSPFIWCGVAIAIRNYKHEGFLLILTTFIGALTTSILTSDPPYWPRLVMLMPICAFFIALTLYTTYQTAINFMGKNKRYGGINSFSDKVFYYLIICIIFLFVGSAGITDWLEYRKTSTQNANVPVLMARFTTTLPPETEICSFSNWNATQEREVVFMSYPRLLKVIPVNSTVNPTGDCSKNGSIWLLNPKQNAQLSALGSAFPTGQTVTHNISNGMPAFITFSPQ